MHKTPSPLSVLAHAAYFRKAKNKQTNKQTKEKRCRAPDLVLPEGVDQSTIDVVDADAEGRDNYIVGEGCGESVVLPPGCSKSAVDR